MTRIFSVILSLQLLIAPVSYAGPTNSTQTTTEAGTSDKKNETASPQNTIGKGISDAEQSQTNSKYDSDSQHKNGFAFYSKQVLAISTSIIGGSIIEQCRLGVKIPSIITFMAGSLVYIGSEIAGAKAQNDDHNQRIENIKQIEEQLKSQGGEVQKEMLNQRLKEEIATRDYFIKKRNWMIAVTAMYYAAMALAISEETSGIAAGKGAGTGTCAMLAAAYASPCGPKYPKCFRLHFNACKAVMPIGWATTLPNFANPASAAIAQSTCGGAAIYAPGCAAYTTAYLGIAYAGCVPAPGLKAMLFAKAIKMGYSAALTRSSGSNAASYVVVLAGLLQFFVPSLQKLVVASYNYPIPRSVTFGISAALATAVTTGYISRISVAEENIAKLKKLLEHFKSQTDDDTVIGADIAKTPEEIQKNGTQFQGTELKGQTVNHGSAASSVKGQEIKQLANGQPILKKSRTCISGSGDSVDISEKACATPLKISRPTFNFSDNNGGKLLKDAGNITVDMAQAVTEGNMERADALAGTLGGMAAQIKDTALNYQKEKNEILKKVGMKSEADGELLDYQKQLNDQVAAIQMDLVKAAQQHKLNITAADLNLKDGKAGVSETDKSKNGTDIQTVANTNIETIKNGMSPKEESAPGPGSLSEDGLLAGYKEDSSGLPAGITEQGMDSLFAEQNSGNVTDDNPNGLSEDALRAARANGYAQLEDRLKRYGIRDEGISSLSDESIFKQISTRYFMNYSKFSIRRQRPANP